MQNEIFEFVKAAIKNPLAVSTVFPTSRFLAQRLLDLAELDREGIIAEVGCGTGAITKYLSPRLADPKRFIGIELSGDMVAFLRRAFPDMRFEEGAAEILPQLTGQGKVASVVSSLPWTVFSDNLQKRTITGIVEALKDDGVFVTYVCANALLYPQAQHLMGLLNGSFRSVERSPLEWRNVPPAFVYVCRK